MYNELKNYLKENNIRVNKLAEMSGIHKQDLYTVLKGKKPFYPKWKNRVAKALNISISLIDEEERSSHEIKND